MKKILLMTLLFFFLTGNLFALQLPPAFPDPGLFPGTAIPTAIQYGDFYSYSLPLLDYMDNGVPYSASDDWYVGSPNPQSDAIIIYTNANDINEINPAGMDQAYDAPTESLDNSSYYMTQADDPSYPNGNQAYTFSEEFLGDSEEYWDSTLSSLTTFLDGSDLTFFFNNNQKGSTDIDGNPLQNLFGWGQVQISDSNNQAPTIYFDFTDVNTGNDVTQYANTSGAGPENPYVSYGDPGSFVLSGGDLCVSADGTTIHPGPCTVGETVLDHNLGFNTAAYALNSPELDAFLANWTIGSLYDTFSVDMSLEFLNDGPEQLFILRTTAEDHQVVPEPSTFILLGSGLIGLVWFGRKRK